MAKFKNERFREKDYMFSIDDFEKLADEEEKARLFVRNFVTEIRVKKMVDKLKEYNKFSKSRKFIEADNADEELKAAVKRSAQGKKKDEG